MTRNNVELLLAGVLIGQTIRQFLPPLLLGLWVVFYVATGLWLLWSVWIRR